jgi:hypothetical protein
MGSPTTITESKIRGRNDDGSESTATWKAAENTGWTQKTNETFRVRFMLAAGAAGAGVTFANQLQYQLNGGSWTNVTTSSSVVKAVGSANLTDNDVTTEQMAGSQTFQDTGRVIEDGIGPTVVFGPSTDQEDEFSLQIVGADVVTGDEINLRTTKSGVAMDAYGVATNPLITVDDPIGFDSLLLLGVS